MKWRQILLMWSVTLAVIAPAGTVAAQGQAAAAAPDTNVVIVTARQVKENIQRVPATVTAVSAVQLRKQNILTVSDLATTVPSLTVASYFNDLNAHFAVRGLGGGNTQLVETYFSEAPCCSGVASAPFMDVSSVQVLSGPQGTLFGRSSAAGAVLVTPQHPKMNDFSGLVDATVGTYDRMQFTGVINIPLITDHLAVRFAANANHVDGYTHLIGTSQTLDGINNQQYRAAIEFNYGGFDNYLVGQFINVDESGTGQVLAAANTNYVNANLLISPAQGVTRFTGVCTSAVNAGLAGSVDSCISQRTATLNNIGHLLLTTPVHNTRSTLPSYDGTPLVNEVRHGSLVDIAQYDFGSPGGIAWNVKNIFSYDSYGSDSSETSDGIGGQGEQGAFGNAAYTLFGANNEAGSVLTASMGPPVITYTDEVQVHANVDHGLLIGTLGAFYQDFSVGPTNQGTTNLYKLFAGTGNVNLGYNNAQGFVRHNDSNESAWYAQATLDLDKVGVHGLSLTAGYRNSWDYSTITQVPAVLTLPSGVFVPGTTPITTTSKSNGYNFTFSAAEQVDPDLMFYGTVARAYVPGGVNSIGVSGAQGLPSFSPTYTAETVLEEEIGAKWDFRFGGAYGRLDVDVYNNDFSNIFETFTGLTTQGASVRYNANIAAATLRGVEVQGTFYPTSAWEVSVGYSYNDAKYTKWTGSDPFNVAHPGSSACLPSSPVGFCFLNLTNNPFPYMPQHQGHVTVLWHLPVDDNWGKMSLSATVYGQSREFFEATAARDLQLFPGGLNGISQAPYATLNLRFDWENMRGSGWDGAVFATNVTNAVYATGKVPQLETLGFSAANYAPPVMVGVQVRKQFGL